jgi:hypothetical protein
VLVDHSTDGRQIQAQLAHELACVLRTYRVDVVLLNRAPVELAYAIIVYKRLLGMSQNERSGWKREMSKRERPSMASSANASPMALANLNPWPENPAPITMRWSSG